MNPIIGHVLANGALLGGAMALSGVGSLAATMLANVLFLAFALAATVSTLALVADGWAMRRNQPPVTQAQDPPALLRTKPRPLPVSLR